MKPARRVPWLAMISVLMALLAAGTARAAVLYVTSDTENKVGEYNAANGAVINANLITGLSSPYSIASDASGNLYVGGIGGTGTIGKYGADGSVINASLLSGIKSFGLAVDGTNLYVAKSTSVGSYTTAGGTNFVTCIGGLSTVRGIAIDQLGHLYVANNVSGAIGKYNTSGWTTVNASLFNVTGAYGIAYSGGNLYVTSFSQGKVFAYDATTGLPTAGFTTISLTMAAGISIYGGNLFVTSYNGGKVGQYGMDGSTINASLITGLTAPVGILVVPEPSTFALVLGVGGALLLWKRRRIARA